MRATAPKLGDRVLVTDLASPEITHEVLEVLAYDTEHEAWQVGVHGGVEPKMCGVRPSFDTTMWVRESPKVYGGLGTVMHFPWKLYNINSPLAVEAKR